MTLVDLSSQNEGIQCRCIQVVNGKFLEVDMRFFACLFAAVAMLALLGCGTKHPAELGTPGNPIKMAMVPSLDTQKLLASGKDLQVLLEKETGYSFDVSVPTSYVAVVEAMDSGKVDVGWLPPLPYVLAHDKYGVDVALITKRNNAIVYQAVILARTDSGLNTMEDLKGKTFAYGDPLSTSGTLYPKHMIRLMGEDPEKFFANTINAGKHDAVVSAIVGKQVDAGAVYGSESSDSREQVLTSIPDVMSITKVIARSEPIPNDTVSVRKGLPTEMVTKIKDALIKIAASEDGRRILRDLYGIDGFEPAQDSDYNPIRDVAREENITLGHFGKEN